MLWVTVCASMDQMLMVSSKSGAVSASIFMHKCQLSFDCGHSKTAAADISGGCSLFGHRISIADSVDTGHELAPAPR
jgi:hypothetical protein